MSIDYSGFKFAKQPSKKKTKKDISTKNRKIIREMYNGKCALCGKPGSHIHHIVYRSEDINLIDDLDNLILLCLECHEKVHSNKKYWQERLKNRRMKNE